ncbi:MAG: VWA domain-containing protein, partial [Gammaproteobacteria bacterium]|nr:VWA domain-containing protein [Gammaproteobacteria bacterium]
MKTAVFLLFTVLPVFISQTVQAAKFSIAVIPDTQFYAEVNPDVAAAQLQWIADNRVRENIVYVASLGDMKDDFSCDNKDLGGGITEWSAISNAYTAIEAAATGLPEGIPYGVTPGNHDFDQVDSPLDPDSDPDSCPDYVGQRPLTLYNSNFGPARFTNPATSTFWSYYGGPRVPGNNEDNFTQFSTCGIDFVSINLGYRENPNGTASDPDFLANNPELEWANQRLQAAPGSLGILTSHFFVEEHTPGTSTSFGSYGAQVAGALAPNPNLFLMLSAHRRGEAWRTESRPGLNPIQALLADYQDVLYPTGVAPDFAALDSLNENGISGDLSQADSGFMRILRFDTVTGMVEVTTFTPAITSLGRPTDLVSDVVVTSGINMSKFTASNFSFSYAGYVNTPPAAGNVSITDVNGGLVVVGDTLTGSYTYIDADGDLEGATTVRWLRDGVPIPGATSSSYALTAADFGTGISFEVTAVATTGATSGCADVSSKINVPADVVLVLDRSGSMGGLSAVAGTKLQAMQSAANLFVDQIAADGMHRLGLVQFNQAPVAFTPPDDFPFAMVNGSNAGDAQDAVNSIIAGGSTDILGGLQEGVDTLGVVTPANSRRIVVLFTDGQHNTPSVLSDADLQSGLENRIDDVDTDMELFSIGFGTNTSDVALSGAANSNDGWHINEVDSMGLAKNFTRAAAAVMDDETLVDPIFELEPGGIDIQPVLVTAMDRDLTVVVNWDSFNKERIQTELFAPGEDECRIESGGDDVYRRGGVNYAVIHIDLPFVCAGRLRHAGEWRIRISAS